jgi:glutamine amidotransferase
MYCRLDVTVSFATTAEEIRNANRIVFPGVGSYDRVLAALDTFPGLRSAMETAVLANKVPFLGICLGMQLLFESSEEGTLSGFGWINGTCRKIRGTAELPVPHMGWGLVRNTRPSRLLERDFGERFYFAHSYSAYPVLHERISGVVDYGVPLAAVVEQDNIFGVQFHPEKSHRSGMRVLRQFACV